MHILHTVLYTFSKVLFNNQELLQLVIIPFILMTFKLESGVKLVEGTSWENCSTTGLLFRD